MVYSRFVQVGRVALVTSGPYSGNLVVIVDIINQTKALVEGPCTDVPRQALNFKSLQLTDFVISISHSTKTKLVKKAFEDAEISKKWAESAWARKLERRRQRRLLSDFDRYKVKKLKQKKSRIVKTEFNKLKKEA